MHVAMLVHNSAGAALLCGEAGTTLRLVAEYRGAGYETRRLRTASDGVRTLAVAWGETAHFVDAVSREIVTAHLGLAPEQIYWNDGHWVVLAASGDRQTVRLGDGGAAVGDVGRPIPWDRLRFWFAPEPTDWYSESPCLTAWTPLGPASACRTPLGPVTVPDGYTTSAVLDFRVYPAQ